MKSFDIANMGEKSEESERVSVCERVSETVFTVLFSETRGTKKNCKH